MNTESTPVRMAMIGCGGMARHHVRRILQQQNTTQIAAICEPSEEAYEAFCQVFAEAGAPPPPNAPDLDKLLREYEGRLDAAFIITPHALHHDQARACMEAGVDVLLEKPMVMNAAEALGLIETRDRTGRLLVVSFNGSLSPQIRKAAKMLHGGELGDILNISATVWQNWKLLTTGKWRQVPEMSGGFMFDTGAHMLNTVVDLAGEDFVEVAAWLDNRGAPVDILGAVMARTRSGVLATLNGLRRYGALCAPDVRAFCTEGILRTGVWGASGCRAAPGRMRCDRCARRLRWVSGSSSSRCALGREPVPAGDRLAHGGGCGMRSALAAEGGRPVWTDSRRRRRLRENAVDKRPIRSVYFAAVFRHSVGWPAECTASTLRRTICDEIARPMDLFGNISTVIVLRICRASGRNY